MSYTSELNKRTCYDSAKTQNLRKTLFSLKTFKCSWRIFEGEIAKRKYIEIPRARFDTHCVIFLAELSWKGRLNDNTNDRMDFNGEMNEGKVVDDDEILHYLILLLKYLADKVHDRFWLNVLQRKSLNEWKASGCKKEGNSSNLQFESKS